MNKSLRVLFLSPPLSETAPVVRVLRNHFSKESIVQVDGREEFRRVLQNQEWGLVLADSEIMDFGASEVLAMTRTHSETLPFILLTHPIGEEATVDLLKFGADDVVLKEHPERLNFAIERIRREARIRAHEIEARKAAERIVRAREQMLAIVSHDLRNPLGAIQLNVETIQKKLLSASTLEETRQALPHLKSILRSYLRMKSLVSDVLDKVRLESGNFTVHRTRRNLSDFLSEVAEVFGPLAQEKRVHFQLHSPQPRVDAVMDFERIYQILSNLLGNAVKFSSVNGQVILRASLEAGAIEFQVKDTGPGIPAEHLDKIFERYWQMQSSPRLGVGLGLAIVKDLVKAHGGKIWVESEPGHGTCFGFQIPCDWTESQATVPRAVSDVGKKICLVDDDDDLRDILEENLLSLGYRVLSFASGHAALRGLALENEFPDLMLVDFRLPDMTGGELIEQLGPELQRHGIPVIFLSAETNLSALAAAHNATAFLAKPLRLGDLTQVIEHLTEPQMALPMVGNESPQRISV